MSEKLTTTGGCHCGRVRYRVTSEPREAYLCHCRMCQRATGGVSIALANFRQAGIVWEQEPDWYRSSPIAERPFCSHCGTPLGFRFLEGSDNMDLTVGSFDDPSGFRPKHHFGAESLQEAWIDTSGLPRYKTTDYDVLVRKWKDAGTEPPA